MMFDVDSAPVLEPRHWLRSTRSITLEEVMKRMLLVVATVLVVSPAFAGGKTLKANAPAGFSAVPACRQVSTCGQAEQMCSSRRAAGGAHVNCEAEMKQCSRTLVWHGAGWGSCRVSGV